MNKLFQEAKEIDSLRTQVNASTNKLQELDTRVVNIEERLQLTEEGLSVQREETHRMQVELDNEGRRLDALQAQNQGEYVKLGLVSSGVAILILVILHSIGI